MFRQPDLGTAAPQVRAWLRGGKIVNIGSLTSALARAMVAPDTVAKGGIEMLTQAKAAEWTEHGLHADAIGPGDMITDMNQALIANPDFDASTPCRVSWRAPRPLPASLPFHALDSVPMTPHMSGWTEGAVRRRQQTVADTVNRLARGEALVNLLWPTRG